MVEGAPTACLLVGTEPMARSAAGLTLRLGIADCELRIGKTGARFGGRVLEGLDVSAKVIRSRAAARSDQCISLSTEASYA